MCPSPYFNYAVSAGGPPMGSYPGGPPPPVGGAYPSQQPPPPIGSFPPSSGPHPGVPPANNPYGGGFPPQGGPPMGGFPTAAPQQYPQSQPPGHGLSFGVSFPYTYVHAECLCVHDCTYIRIRVKYLNSSHICLFMLVFGCTMNKFVQHNLLTAVNYRKLGQTPLIRM